MAAKHNRSSVNNGRQSDMDRPLNLGYTINRDSYMRDPLEKSVAKADGMTVPGAAGPGVSVATNLMGYSLEGTHAKHPLHTAAGHAGFKHVMTTAEVGGPAHHYVNGAGASLKLKSDGGFSIAGKAGKQDGVSDVDLEAASDKEKAASRQAEGRDNHAYRGWDTRRQQDRDGRIGTPGS